MNLFSALLIIIGLCLFETISSIDNAIINAQVLSTMGQKARRWFLTWGIFFAVFIVRGLLPWLIIWVVNPDLGFFGSLTAVLNSTPESIAAMEKSTPILLSGGGIFLIFLFFEWLFIEEKNYSFEFEKFFDHREIWFYAFVSVILLIAVWFALQQNHFMAFAEVAGSTVFFITHGFKHTAEKQEKELMKSKMSDISKVLYLEVIDTTFSIDGVIGAFAFTLYIPLILIGNGLGAIMVRQITMGNIDGIKKYAYLKNGAMYSVFFLGTIMLLESYRVHIPHWLSPALTCSIIGYFFYRSKKELKNNLPHA